jgi:DNA polymerase
MILGEAPGREEDRLGMPFVGASGKLLRSELTRAGLPLKQCYITNSVKCFPDGTPSEEDVRKCGSVYLKNEVALLQPSYILAVGRIALSTLVPGWKLSDVKGQLLGSWLNDGFVFPVWHPAYILRNRSKMDEWRIDLENFAAVVKVDLGL